MCSLRCSTPMFLSSQNRDLCWSSEKVHGPPCPAVKKKTQRTALPLLLTRTSAVQTWHLSLSFTTQSSSNVLWHGQSGWGQGQPHPKKIREGSKGRKAGGRHALLLFGIEPRVWAKDNQQKPGKQRRRWQNREKIMKEKNENPTDQWKT